MNKIDTLHLFPKLTEELLLLLKELKPTEWLTFSPISNRTVKDLVSHLIDGSLRRLSMQRDSFFDSTNTPNIKSYNSLVNFIQTLNNDWITVSRRLSPRILIDFLKYSEYELYNYFKTLNLNEKAFFAVAWAGENESENWFDIAREYTEKWHHQMQIRMALKKPILLDTEYTLPLYETFFKGLPYLFYDLTNFNDKEIIKITITGTLTQSWYIEKSDDNWLFLNKPQKEINTCVEIPDDIAWVIFTNTDRDKEKYKEKIKITGNEIIRDKLLDFVTVMS